MNKKTFILPIAGFIALLFSCSGDSIQSEVASPVETKARLYVTVLDASDGKPVSGAELTMQSIESKPKAITSDNGVAVFENVHVGSHLVLVEAANYASEISEAYIDNKHDGDIYIAQDKVMSVSLYSLTASFEGYVYHTNGEGKYVPIKGLPIRFQSNNITLQDTLETKTNENGRFTFPKLPAVGRNYQIITTGTAAPIDGKTYGAKVLYNGSDYYNRDKALNKNVNIKIEKINLDSLGEGEALFLVKEYNKVIEETEPLTFKFSDAIDRSRINSGTVTFSPEVANIVWGDSSVTLNPVGKWKGGTDGEFTVKFSNLYSVANKEIISSSYPVSVKQVDLRNMPVQGLLHLDSNEIRYTSPDTRITFKKLDGATKYEFYLKEEVEGKMVTEKIDCDIAMYTLSKIDTIVRCPVSMNRKNPMNFPMIGSKRNTIIVRASNSRFENEFDKSAKVEIYERKNPAPDLIWNGTVIYDHYVGGRNGLPLPYSPESDLSPRNHDSHGSGAASYINFYGVQGNSITNVSVAGPNTFDARYSLSKKLGRGVADSVAEGRLFFNRAMDTNEVPHPECTFASGTINPCGRLGMDFKWINEQNLSVKVKVIAGEPIVGTGEPINAIVKISKLVALNKTGFASTYNGIAPDSLKTVNIEFNGEALTACQADAFASGCTDDAQKKAFCVDNWDTDARCRIFTECEIFPLEMRPVKPACRILQEGFEGNIAAWHYYSSMDWLNWWVVDNGASPDESNRSAYITDDGYSYHYSSTTSGDMYANIYTQVSLPAKSAPYKLSFQWKGIAEGPYYDYMVVCLIPTSESVTETNCYYGSAYDIGGKAYSSQPDWTLEEIDIPLTYNNGNSYYLVFGWKSDDYKSIDTPTAIDNIILQ